MKNSELRYRRLFETAQDGILILDADSGRIEDVNPFLTRMLGYAREQLVGRNFWDLVPPGKVEAARAEFKELQHESYVRYDDIPLESRDGRKLEVEVVSNIYEVRGERVAQCNIRDISDRRRAEDQLKGFSRKLQVLSRRLVEAQETERRRIARELHDEIGQALTSAQINLQTLLQAPEPEPVKRRLRESLEVVEHALEQVRDISLNLRPAILDDLGLVPALRWFTQRQVALVGLQVDFQADPLERRLDPVIETECFRVAQGALTNVVRHARARTVNVELRRHDRRLHLRVRDDGAGFDVGDAWEKAVRGASLGLLSMEERAVLVGGGIEFKSAPGQGAEVHAWFPLKWKSPTGESKSP